MNFYKHHLGDYAQATGHLSFVEDAAYSRLLRKYYAEEKPIPGDMKAAQRLVGARSRDEKEAVETVLNEFFTLDTEQNVWRNKRAEEEIAKAAAQASTNQRIAEEREARKRARNTHDQSTNRADSDNESLHDQSTNRQPSQTPDSRLHQEQEQEQELPARALSPDDVHEAATSTAAGRACLLLRQAGCVRFNPSNPELLAAIAEGVPLESIRDAYLEKPNATNPFAWAIAKARGQHAEGPKPVNTSPPGHAAKPAIAQNFSNKSYTGTPDDELPEFLRTA